MKRAKLAMRDERTKLLTFVNTWIDGVPSNLDKSLAKIEDEQEQRARGRTERKGKTERMCSGWKKRVYM